MVEPHVLAGFLRDVGLNPRQNSVSYIFDCPRCGKSKKLYIRKRDGRFVCWFCRTSEEGFEGRAEYALAEILQISAKSIAAKLYLQEEMPEGVFLDYSIEDWFDNDEEEEEAEGLRVLQWPLDYYPLDHPHAARGVKYLVEERGIPIDIAMEYGIRYAPAHRRVVFPVQSTGALYGWQERLVVPHRFWSEKDEVWKEVAKALSSKEIPRDRVLMFADRLRGSDHAVVCEGPIDGLKAHLCGGNVVTMGKGVSIRQMRLIRNSGIHKVYLALDPDAGDEAERLALEFSDMEVYIMDPRPYKDLGEMTMEAVLELFRSAPRINTGRCFVGIDSILCG